MLSNTDIIELTALRRELHRQPELSGEEIETAKTISAALNTLSPTHVLTGLGGHGVAAVFDSGIDGPTVLFRAELDALPIQEISSIPWASTVAGKGHMCGHDGHMMFLMALGRIITRDPIARGRVILMFQPSEEDGTGARAVVAEPVYKDIQPDYAFAIHVEPGRPFAHVSTRAGLINCASHGLEIKLTGKTAHAADPEDGVSPALAVAKIIVALDELGKGGELNNDFELVTVTHIQVGEYSFGIAPGEAIITATLRTAQDNTLRALDAQARALSEAIAVEYGLTITFNVHDAFAATVNNTQATNIAIAAMNAIGVEHSDTGLPMRASEDFGVFGWDAKAAMLCIGPGEHYAALHNPDYDFPDDLIPVGTAIFERITRDLLGSTST